MKYLEYPELELLSKALTFESPECKVNTRFEAYTCKAVAREKRLFKALESNYVEDISHSASLSPPEQHRGAMLSAFGPLDEPRSRKTLYLLIATLNGAFPDHDFSEVRPEAFRREPSASFVLNSLSQTLLSLRSSSGAPRSYSSYPDPSWDDAASSPSQSFSPPSHSSAAARAAGSLSAGSVPPVISHPVLQRLLDNVIGVQDSEVYTYNPDVDSDPHATSEDEDEDWDEEEEDADEEGDWSSDRSDGMAVDHEDMDEEDEEVDIDDQDAPLFDEDVYGTGFASPADGTPAQTTPPATPSSKRKSKGFSRRYRHSAAAAALSKGGINTIPATYTYGKHASPIHRHGPSSLGSSSRGTGVDSKRTGMTGLGRTAMSVDAGTDATGGLLWTTYAFFYNRKMKRVLFVSVWARKNTSRRAVDGWDL